MSSDFVISSLLLIAAFTCREVAATCNMTSDTATTCSMDAGPLKKLFIPVDESIGECRCDMKLADSNLAIQRTIIKFTNHMISKPNCPYKITFMENNYAINCEKIETLSIPVSKERSALFSITKDSSITDSTTTTGGFCLNMTILQGMFNISCRSTSISGTTDTDLTTSTDSTVLNTNKDPSITGEDIMTKTTDVAQNTYRVKEVTPTCNMTSDTATTCCMDAGPLRKLFLPVDGSIGECRCNMELVHSGGERGTGFQKTVIQFTNHIISNRKCPYKITLMDYNYTISCEKSESVSIPVNKTRSVVFSITKDSSITTTTGGFCLNMTILQGMFNISCRPTSISGTTETDLTASIESTELNTNADIMTTTKELAQNTNRVKDEPIKEFPVTAVASGIAGGVVVIIIIIIITIFIWYVKRKNNIYDKPVQRRRDEHVYGNIQTRSFENLDISGQREDRSQGSPPRHTCDIGVGCNDSNPVTSSEKTETSPSKKANNGETIYENIASDL